MEEAKKLNVIGKVTIDVVELNKYYQTLDALEDMVRFLPSTNDDSYWRLHSKYFKELDGYGLERNTLPTKKVGNEHWTRTVILQSDITVFISKVSDFLDVVIMDVSEVSDDSYYVIIPKKETLSFMVPKRFVVKENIYDTFEDVPMGDILLLKGTSNLSEEEKSSLALIGDKSKNELQSILESRKQEVVEKEQMLKEQIKEIEHKAEIMISEAKLKIAELMRPLVLDIETMTDKLYMFETQIYSTLSFLGMTIDIEKLASGNRADIDEPLYIWQKLRYLDEELPKLVSLFDIEFDDFKIFEKILVENPLIRNFFLPNEKTVTVFKTSRKGIRMVYTPKESLEKGDKYSWTNYILSSQDIAHGDKAALLMRDGDNVYIAWTDEDKIYVNDDNLFYTSKTQGVEAVNYDFKEEDDVNRWVEEDRGSVALDNIKTLRSNYAIRRKKTEHPLARLYLKSIIEGLLKRGDILRIPIEENITDAINNRTRYIRFRAEDLALKENTYGTMDELLDLSKRTEPRAGEDIYIITRDGGKGRGRGDSNRAHDAGLSIGLDKISVVDYYWSFFLILPVQDHHLVYNEKKGWVLSDIGKAIEYRTNLKQKPYPYDKQEDKTKWYDAYFYKLVDVVVNETDIRPEIEESKITKALKSNGWGRKDEITLEEYGFKFDIEATEVERKVYVSAEKAWSYSGDARANLEIYEGEFINLTHWNSEWLAYAIRNHYTFKRFYGGDFATQLPYLQEMLDFLRNREKEFGKLVFNHYGKDLPSKWQVTLSHWMNDRNYRNFSDFRAKQFAKYLK